MGNPLVLRATPCSTSSGSRLLDQPSQRRKNPGPKDSELLSAIRAAFQGSGKEPEHPLRTTLYASVDGQDGEEELAWNETTVAWSIGGTLRNTWSFREEGQRVQYACFGWLLTEGTIHSHSGAPRQAINDDTDDESSYFHAPDENQRDRDVFGPFFRARRARMRTVEPTTISRGLFVFLRNFGRIYLFNGLEFSFSLPFIVHRAWPLSPHGVLIERVVDPLELDEADPMPRLYTMTNPFQEPKTVGHAKAIKGGHGFSANPAEISRFDSDDKSRSDLHADEQIVWIAPRMQDTSDSDNIFVTIDHGRRKLSFWRYVYNSCRAALPDGQDPRTFMNGEKHGGQIRQAGADMVSRGDRIRAPSPEFEPASVPSMHEFSLPGFPGMPPPLTSTSTLASLTSSGSGISQWPASSGVRMRRSSLTRNDLTSTMDRMVLDRKSDAHTQGQLPSSNQSTLPVYWVQRLFEWDVDEADLAAWKDITFAIHDQRFDGKKIRSQVAFCLPVAQEMIRLTLTSDQADTLKLTLDHRQLQVRSIAAVKAVRPNIWDLLMLKSDYTLSILTFERAEVHVDIEISSPTSLSSPVNISIRSDADVSMSSTPERPKVISLNDVLVSNATLKLESGDAFRVNFNLFPTDSLVQSLMVTLSTSLKHDHFAKIWIAFLNNWNKAYFTSLPNAQFDCLSSALLDHWGIKWVSTEQPSSDMHSSDWSDMLSSTQHFRLQDDVALTNVVPPHPPQQTFSSKRTLSRNERGTIHILLTGLGVLGDELRLLQHEHESFLRLSTLTVRLAQITRPGFFDCMMRLTPCSANGWNSGLDMTSKGEVLLPADFASCLYMGLAQPNKTLESIISKNHVLGYGLGGTQIVPIMRELAALFSILSDHEQPNSRKRAEATVLSMAQRQFGADFLHLLPLFVSMPLREAARTSQLGPPSDWPSNAYDFIGRNDLTESSKVYGDLMFDDGYRTVKDHLKTRIPRKTIDEIYDEVSSATSHIEDSVTGVELEITKFTDVRFGQDRRLLEVARMLRSSVIPSIRMADRPDLSDHDLAKEQSMQVLRTAERTLGLPIGRAMFTFATVSSVTREMYCIPKIELTIRLQPQGITIAPEQGKLQNDALNWAEFHNGVAASLRISPSTGAIDSSWISFNRPSELTAEHAGFLFGLGLTGHLKQMLTWHTFGYLTPKHEMTSIGVLLGLAAANVGSANKHVTKLLAVHTPAFLPSPDVDLNVPLTTQSAGLIGIGLLYMGTKNRLMAEVALHQISRTDILQTDLTNECREAYTLSAAISFGMIMLGKGTSASNPADVALLSRLRVLIHGEGPQKGEAKQDFDLTLTSPAAALATGLMYLKTGRKDVADIMTIPDTVAALNLVQPNLLLIRTIARNLIMWDEIKPNQKWLVDQIPKPIMQAMEKREPFQAVDDAIELAYYHITSGAIFSLALKYAGTASQEAFGIIAQFFDFFHKLSSNANPAFDYRIKRAASRDGLSIVTLSMGMVMVGTGELNCLKRLRLAHGMYSHVTRYGSHMATHMALGLLFLGEGRFSLGSSDSAIVCMIAAFYPHFPVSSSDTRTYLPALRHLWVLAVEPRCLVARDVDTKEVIYLPMKIRLKDAPNPNGTLGFIAPTVIPSLDRILTIKIDTPRYWPFLLDIQNNPRHKNGLLQSQTLFVKRRALFLSYMEDPKGSRSLFVRSGLSTGDAATLDCPQIPDEELAAHPASDIQHYIASHSNDVSFLAFADRLCRYDGLTSAEKTFNAFCHATLLDCIMQDKPRTLTSYLSLYRARNQSPRSRLFNVTQQDISLTADFYGRLWERRYSGRQDGIIRPPLLRENAVLGVVKTQDEKLRIVKQKPEFQKMLRAYVLNDNATLSTKGDPDVRRELGWYLHRHAVPFAPYLPMVQQLAMEMLSTSSQKIEGAGTEAGAKKLRDLEQAVKLTLHASVANLVRPFGMWSIESFNDILKIWSEN